MRQTAPILLALIGVMVAPSQASAEDPEMPALGVDQDSAIYGGDSTNYCGWPSAVYVELKDRRRCSGTLVHQDIVITAGHCPPLAYDGGEATIHFGEDLGISLATSAGSVGATCFSGPSWPSWPSWDGSEYVGAYDYGYCKLHQPATGVPIIPPAYGCAVDELVTGKEVVIVGFGKFREFDTTKKKRQATTTITSINDVAVIGGGGLSTCSGDSGGPVFAQMSDDSWRSFGITSGGDGFEGDLNCGGPGTYALMHIAIPWIEAHSDVDITPCHDVNGDWNPTPACRAIPLDPASTNGANWNNSCSGGPLSGFSGLCGAPFEARDDTDPPSVSIVTPSDSTVYDLGPTDVPVSVNADDGHGHGVASVTLLVNGEEFGGDGAAPYKWSIVFPEGAYTLTAVAVDFEGNEAVSAPVSIDVEQESPINETDSGTAESGGAGASDPIEGCSCSIERGGAGDLGLAALLALGLIGLRPRKD